MSYQTKVSISQVLSSAFSLIQTLDFTDNKLDDVQRKLDDILYIVNDKIKDTPKDVSSVDLERKRRRDKPVVDTKPV